VISAVILAAGRANRLGVPKLLLKLGGVSLLRRALDIVLASEVDDVAVVLGRDAEGLRPECPQGDPRVRVLENPRYWEGQSASLKAGISALSPEAEAALIMLADQPLVTPATIDALVDKYRQMGKPVVAPFYRGQRGNPVLFARSLFPELLAIEGDVGGRGVVSRHHEDMARVDFETALPLKDIDTWEDYLALCALVEAGVA